MTTELTPGFYDIPSGMVVEVVTYLEMTEQPILREAPTGVPDVSIVSNMDIPTYRDLFMRVGALDWLWYSRMALYDAQLSEILNNSEVTLATMLVDGQPEALLELDFRTRDECELAFFGVSPRLIGTGAGRALMNAAIQLAWSRPIKRFHVHTCTLDHPGALGFYRRSGFIPTHQQVEIAPDPRLTGVLPKDAGPHIPMFP